MREQNQIRILIEAAYGDLRPSEQKVADYILRWGDEIRGFSLEKLAKASGVSQPTVMRLMKVLGFTGYREFQYAMVEETARGKDSGEFLQTMYGCNISRQDTVQDIPGKIMASTSRMLQQTLKSISIKTFAQVIEKLKSARIIDIYGVENSQAAVNDLATKLLYLGMNCRCFTDHYLQKISAVGLTEQDVAIGISYSGQSKDTVDAVRQARESGAATIVITNFQESLLSHYADLLICTSQEQFFYGDAIFSRTAQMMISDMIYTGIVASDYDRYARRLDYSSQVICDEAYEKRKK